MGKTQNKINKNTVPEGFTVGMAMVDLLPVIFFGLTAIIYGFIMRQWLIPLGAIFCFVSGLVKVAWKLVAAIKGKNIWPMFVQMRIFMPFGFVLIIIGSILARANFSTLGGLFTSIPCLICLILGCLGMVLMFVFAFKLDGSDPKSNWIEQITNGIAQAMFFAALLILYLSL